MYSLKRFYILSIIFILCHFPMEAQSDSCVAKLATFARNINAFNHLNPQEKVYLHFDNTGYFAGDTIWFKAYVVTATDIKPTIHSRVLYVELLAPEGQVVETKRLKVEKGQCHGEFALDKYFRSGFYEVRAYTRVMLNYDSEIIFSRVFPVYKEPEDEGDFAQRSMKEPYQNIDKLREKSEERFDKVNISFFPEGGNLIYGLTSKIAFKATDSNGQGIDVTGAVYNEKDEEITTFSSTHNGMGFFTLCPDSTNKKVKINFQEKDYTFPLPKAIPEGYVMTVNNMSKDFLLVQLQKNAICIGDTLGITVTCRGKVIVFDVSDMTNQQEYIIKIPKKDLLTGVNQVTAFTRYGEVLAQRMVFVNNDDEFRISHKQSKKSYGPFEKVKLDFSIKDKIENPFETSFSLAVRDAATQIPGHYSENIKSDMLLSSDIKGFIENVDYFFESDDNRHKQALDLLMMTQGWSRYSWRQMAGIETFECRHKIEKGIVIDGKVYTEKIIGKKVMPNVEVNMWMYSDEGASQRGVCMTDNEGRFNFLAEDFTGKWNLTLDTKEKGKTIWTSVPLDRTFSPKPKAYSFLETDTPEIEVTDSVELITALSKEVRSITQVQILKKVTLRATRNRFVSQDIVYDVEKEIDDMIDQGKSYPPNVSEYLINRNPKFWFESFQGSKRTGTFRYGSGGWLTIGFDEQGNWHRGWLYNERFCYFRPITEVQKIVVSADKELWNKFVNRGPGEPRFTVYTVVFAYPFKNAAARSQKGIRITYLNGYSQVKEFYNPDYSKGVIPGDVDYRRTLYWNPNVKTDSLGNASVSFYNNSTCKKMTISAETLTSEGIPIVYKQ